VSGDNIYIYSKKKKGAPGLRRGAAVTSALSPVDERDRAREQCASTLPCVCA